MLYLPRSFITKIVKRKSNPIYNVHFKSLGYGKRSSNVFGGSQDYLFDANGVDRTQLFM